MFLQKKLKKNEQKRIVDFDEEAYSMINSEVLDAIAKGDVKDVENYLQTLGWEKIKEGIQQFHKDFEPFKEERYLELFPDIAEAVSRGDFQSGFEHFCRYGYIEIISGIRQWSNNEKSEDLTETALLLEQQNIFAHIDEVGGNIIHGWAGKKVDVSINVKIFINGDYIDEVVAEIDRPDVREYVEYQYCKGFTVDIPRKNLIYLINQMQNGESIFIVTLSVNNEMLQKEFEFSLKNWLSIFLKEFSRENLLMYLPFLGKGIENFLSLEKLIEALKGLEDYKLSNVLIDEKNLLVNAILQMNTIDENGKEILVSYLYENHELLMSLAKGLYEERNLELLSIINKILNSMNPLDAWQMIQSITFNKKNIFTIDKLQKQIHDDKEIWKLSKSSDLILDYWQQLNNIERKEKAFVIMGLLVFLQDYEKLSLLDLTSTELSEAVSCSNEKTIFALQECLIKKNASWEGLLITLYYISLGLQKKDFIYLVTKIIDNLNSFNYINTSAFAWIVKKLILKEVDDNILIEIIQKLQENFIEKSLWNDSFVKQINQSYINFLLKKKHNSFFEAYKLCLQYYLLDKEFLIEKSYLSLKFLNKESLLWLESIEDSRKQAIKLLGDNQATEELIAILSTIEYLSPEIVQKIRFEVSHTILNFSTEKKSVLNATYEILKNGGNYDKLMASIKMNNQIQYDYYENIFINNTIHFVESNNNIWYHKILLSRSSEVSYHIVLLEELYEYIMTENIINDEQIRLMKLFFSEIIWLMEKGLQLEDINIIAGKTLKDIYSIFKTLNSDIGVYIQQFVYYINLTKKIVNGVSSTNFYDLMEDDFYYKTKENLKTILKIDRNQKLSLNDAKLHMKQAMVYPYSIIMIYSCQAYMDTRQKIIRETWYKRTKELGIDCIFVVGGSKTSYIDDDIMYLAVEDTYEKLPQKSIEMFKFAYEKFSYERFMKVDDDCFVNLDAYFSDDILFKADYYGRQMFKGIGWTDRVWHQEKSSSKDAKKALDLSPEPSTYMDGSTGYVLSRNACRKLQESYKDKKNKSLIENSFMEDKLIGDLLTQTDISFVKDNFISVVNRKISDTVEVTFWEYNILPTINNKVKILHCETKEKMYSVWKNFLMPNMKLNQNQYYSNFPIENFNGAYSEQAFIEEIRLKRTQLSSAKHIAVLVCKDEYLHLPALLEHHRSIGIEHFIYIDNMSSDKSMEFMLAQDDVSVFASTQLYKFFRFSVDWLESVFTNFCYGKWVLVIDADELFVYDDFENRTIDVLTSYADENGYDSFLSPMIDMYSQGKLSEANITDILPYKVCNYFDEISTTNLQMKNIYGPFSNSKVFAGGLRNRVFGQYNMAPTHSYLNQKYCLFKYNPLHKFVEGIHFMGNNNPAPLRAGLLHFKYHAGFYEKVQKQIAGGQHWNGSQEYKRYLSKLESNQNLTLFDRNISIEYNGSKSLIEAGYINKF